MPSNQINPFNYNIDTFDSGILGPITDTNFRTYLFTHNLPAANSVISGVLGGSPWNDRGTEYDVSMSLPKVVDVPNLQDVAQNPSLYNNLTNPRQVNLTSNLPNINPEIANVLGVTTPILAGLGIDSASQMNLTTSVSDLPSAEDAALISGPINNFTQPRQDNLFKNPSTLEINTWYPIEFTTVYNSNIDSLGTSYGIPATLKIGFAGNIETWVSDGGYQTTTHEVRDFGLLARSSNKYGPSEIINYSYGADELVYSNTGFIEYNPQSGSDFRDQLLSRTLGVGVIPFSELGSGINYKPDGQNISDLDSIARKRRGVELQNRIKLNFTDNTVGALNVSPFSLLSGGNLIQQNYKITVPKTGIGKILEFAADLAGFNLPTSIIPNGDDSSYFGSYGVDPNAVDVSKNILDYTGSGQKSLLYNALYINKYSPKLGLPTTTGLKKLLKEKLGAGQAPATQNYLTYTGPQITEKKGRSTSFIDNLNSKIKNLLTKDNGNKPNHPEDDPQPSSPGSDNQGGFYGKFEPFNSVGHNTLGELGNFNGEKGDIPIYEDKEITKNLTTYIGTPVETGGGFNLGVTNERFDWRRNPDGNTFKKGILKYTQQLVNDAKLGSAAGYIGYFDSAAEDGAMLNKNVHQTGAKTPLEKPNRPSKGNTTRNYLFATKDENGNPVGPDTGGEYYCRSWSSSRKYHTFDDLIRSGNNWWLGRDKDKTMTLSGGLGERDATGMPKIAWDSSDSNYVSSTKLKGVLVPYMLSIENLAWKDAPQMINLPPCEVGPNGGRIMWFPPYDINFTDSSSVSWDTTSFIGRGEPIYTYNHTERSGTLDFTIVVDHPAVLNNLKEKFKNNLTDADEAIHSFFAGCDAETIKKYFADVIPPEIQDAPPVQDNDNSTANTNPNQSPTQTETVKPKEIAPPPKNGIKIFFENSYSSKNTIGRVVDITVYEVTSPSTDTVNLNSWNTDAVTYPCGPAGDNSYAYINEGKQIDLEELSKFLVTEDGKNHQINLDSYTSPANKEVKAYNTTLATDRANSLKKYLYDLMLAAEQTQGGPPYLSGDNTNPQYDSEDNLLNSTDRWKLTPKSGDGEPDNECSTFITFNGAKRCDPGNPCSDPLEAVPLTTGQSNSAKAKSFRFAQVNLEVNKAQQVKLLSQLKAKDTKADEIKKAEDQTALNPTVKKIDPQTAEIITNGYINECDYFEAMKREQPFVYTSLAEKIKYFHPAFHAITPEGFNSRLTFLQQCTRQGPQLIDQNQPQNMVFGRPPICVLRIGDFYHTKIVIDSMNLTYDPMQWDLNPEGIGVQPMIAKVSLGFKFIGGSSLGGPISQLQNAVSYNFFANTSVYNPAQVLTDAIATRNKFIYGAFSSPDDQKNKMGEITKSYDAVKTTLQDQPPVTATETKDATPSAEVQKQVEETPPGGVSETKATEGDTKPPTTNEPQKTGLLPKILTGSYLPQNCDEVHAFQSTGGKVVGNMNVIVGDELNKLWSQGAKPKVTNVKVTAVTGVPSGSGVKIEWEVKIEESNDGRAWLGFTSRGAGCNSSIDTRAESVASGNDVGSLKSAINSAYGETFGPATIEKVNEVKLAGLGINSFKQIFYRYTKPKYEGDNPQK